LAVKRSALARSSQVIALSMCGGRFASALAFAVSTKGGVGATAVVEALEL
jgi:hypothetical protein